jgi:hypothetical protein
MKAISAYIRVRRVHRTHVIYLFRFRPLPLYLLQAYYISRTMG